MNPKIKVHEWRTTNITQTSGEGNNAQRTPVIHPFLPW